MFQEVNLKRALEKQLKEKDVYATPRCTEPGKEGYLFIPLSDILKEFRFLVDVPAIENPDFAEAVQKMTQSTPAAQESTQDITQESPEEEEHTEEPLEEHSCKKKLDVPSRELLTLAGQGMSQSAIAKKLGITQSTVSYRLKQLRKENVEPADSGRQPHTVETATT